MFDHSSIAHFIDRIGRDGFGKISDGLNSELLRMGLLSPEMYVDSSLANANVNSHDLSLSGMSVAEFKKQAVHVNGLFMIAVTTVDGDGVEPEEARYFQNPDGRLPLNPVDSYARWRTFRLGQPAGLHYQENIIVSSGFIVSRGVPHASEGEWKAVPGLLEQLSKRPVSLAGDTGYNVGQLRQLLEERNIAAYIPIHPIQQNNMVARGGFAFHGDHLVCWQRKTLRPGLFHRQNRICQYVALQKDCRACRVTDACLPPGQKHRYIGLTMYYPEYLRARERNRTAVYQRERFRRRTIAEGTFASLDRLGWDRSRPARIVEVGL